MGFFSSKSQEEAKSAPTWKALESTEQLEALIAASEGQPQLIFKHSTTCFISKTVLRNFEAEWSAEGLDADIHLLDLLSFRAISNAIAERLQVTHQSPQMILLDKGKVVIHNSHQAISAGEVMREIASLNG